LNEKFFKEGRENMKDKKGQIGVGTILIVAITLIVGAIFLVAIAQSVGNSVNTQTLINSTISTSISNVSTFYIDYRSISNVIIVNGTAGGQGEVVAANYTVTNNVIDPSDGTLSVGITPATGINWNTYGTTWRISGTAQPVTYIADSGGRAMANLIIVMFALAILVVALYPVYESKLLDMIGR
jgi:hypothetical protein